MLKGKMWMLGLVAIVAAMASPALGSVEGNWSVQGPIVVRAKIKGQPAQHDAYNGGESFAFNGDGTFTLDEGSGTWTQTGKRFIVTMDEAQLAAYIQQSLEDSNPGLSIQVTVDRCVLSGRESRTRDQIDHIKGKWSLVLGLYLPDYLLPGKETIKFTFTGTRAAAGSATARSAGGAKDAQNAIAAVVSDIVKGILARKK